MSPASPLTCAIGDVHGRRDLLEALLAAIRADAGGRGARIVFLGDIIDRGPESRASLDIVIEALGEFPGSRLILGNHEEFLLRFLDDTEDRERIARRWFANGGLATLASYGFGETERIDTIAAHFARDFPAHVEALRSAGSIVETGNYVFVHGGIDPELSLDRQDPETTRWIRGKFLDFKGPLPKTVVHGHTVTGSYLPEIHPNRIALDTGAVFSGHLTCAIFDEDGPPRFLATGDHGATVEVNEIRPLICP
jgi:diadenosine tetraphosphatase ApaH/serine/threonine PP2A family protein phosphatase